MKILIYSPAFYPGVGGLENVVFMIASGLAELGCQVKVITTTASNGKAEDFPFEIIRNPSAMAFHSLMKWSDIFFHHNVSLKGIWPLFFVRRPWVIAHHGWYTRGNGALGWQDRLKRCVVRFARHIAVSNAVASRLPVQCAVIPNPYRDDLFRVLPDSKRDHELVFVGRLVSDKGCDLLLDALALLRSDGLKPRLTVVGAGPEESRLHAQAQKLGITDQIKFAGKKEGEELVRILNEHAIMVVPSRWNEPFGIVALEGIASGCVVIGSKGGGLPEAIGPCGLIFPNGDVKALAARIKDLLNNPGSLAELKAGAAEHLAKHNRTLVTGSYFSVLEKTLQKHRGDPAEIG